MCDSNKRFDMLNMYVHRFSLPANIWESLPACVFACDFSLSSFAFLCLHKHKSISCLCLLDLVVNICVFIFYGSIFMWDRMYKLGPTAKQAHKHTRPMNVCWQYIIFCFSRKLMMACVKKVKKGEAKEKIASELCECSSMEVSPDWYWKMCIRVLRIENKRTKCIEWQILSHVMGYWFDNVIFL